jgi:hypothetical protein
VTITYISSQPEEGDSNLKISLGVICGAGGGTMPGSPRVYYEPFDARYLALQLHITFDVSLSSDGLMGASPNGPCDDVSGVDPSLRKTDGDAADFLNRPADQWR